MNQLHINKVPILLSNTQPFLGITYINNPKFATNAKQTIPKVLLISKGYPPTNSFVFFGIITNPLNPNEQSANNGPPKQAANAIIGIPILAIVKFEIKSPTEFPRANTVMPKMSSLRL